MDDQRNKERLIQKANRQDNLAVTLVESNRNKLAAYIKRLFIGRILNSWQAKRGDPDPGMEGMDMSLSKLWKTVKSKEAWRASLRSQRVR